MGYSVRGVDEIIGHHCDGGDGALIRLGACADCFTNS